MSELLTEKKLDNGITVELRNMGDWAGQYKYRVFTVENGKRNEGPGRNDRRQAGFLFLQTVKEYSAI